MKRSAIIAVCSILTVILVTVATNAVTSRLRQEILPTECVLTNISNGSGQQLVADCPTDAPIITEVATTSAGTRIVKGFVDQSRISLLRVLFLGQTYIANTTGSPLTLSNDIWVFSIDAISPLVEAGDYTFTIESIVDGQTLTTTETISLPSLSSVSPDPGSKPQDPSNAAHGFAEIISPVSNPLNADILPPVSFETDFFGNTRIWIDDGVGAPNAGYPATNEFTRSVLVVIAVILVVTGRAIIEALIAFIQRVRK